MANKGGLNGILIDADDNKDLNQQITRDYWNESRPITMHNRHDSWNTPTHHELSLNNNMYSVMNRDSMHLRNLNYKKKIKPDWRKVVIKNVKRDNKTGPSVCGCMFDYNIIFFGVKYNVYIE